VLQKKLICLIFARKFNFKGQLVLKIGEILKMFEILFLVLD